MYNILVTGANGQLGSEIRELASNYKNYTFLFTDVAELDITNHKIVEDFIKVNNINTIFNCAAYTAVDKAESDTEIADKINNLATENFARIAKEKKIKLIHISTDYVFDGISNIPYKENVIPNPQSVYGKTKLDGENAMLKINPENSIIIRTSWVYSSFGNNFVKTMLRLGNERDELNIVADQIGTTTYAKDLATVMLEILPKIKNETVEIFHFSNEGVCSWFDFAKAIFELKEISIKLNPIESTQYPTPAKRPYYSVLSKNKIKEKYQIEIPYWKDSLIECLNKI
ncbi:dTDP-4-dehydrorhamnose reductase [Lutibacter sp. HS1-25]|uniref:dTDP-4-dehydrorhamnose reductase n=1 Tax=Lutibacter sp. HS1-25 TaxID=2485000 RepID=UPI00101146C9|nr:dTDP-4-dehydrorhamnose reductase [Lutibacter sp. HS1-25]RXP61843.1 dTDP-4-dehydrorhamnose reductase [Lutibacter sp. HS1-25]